jgi:hypothetical protein
MILHSHKQKPKKNEMNEMNGTVFNVSLMRCNTKPKRWAMVFT